MFADNKCRELEAGDENRSRFVHFHCPRLRWPPHSELTVKLLSSLCVVIQALIALVNDPEPEHPLRADLAEEYLKDHKKFIKNAEEFTKKHSEKRPNDY